MRTRALFLTALLGAGATHAAAQQSVNQTIPSSETGRVEVNNVAGEVRVIAWDRPEIRITGTLGAGTERLAVEGDRANTQIRVVIPRNARDVKGSQLEVRVPARKDVGVHTTSAEIRVTGVTGEVAAGSTSGDVTVEGTPAAVEARSTSGDVNVHVTSARVRASSTSGDLTVEGAAREGVTAESVSGDVNIGSDTPELVAKTVSGDLNLSGVGRRVVASTVSGDATIRAGTIQYGSFESVSGELHFDGGLQRDGAFNIQNHSGDVVLVLPSNVGADFEVSTFSGDIESDFGGQPRRVSEYAPGQELRFRTGSGGPLISVKTFSGTVRLERK
jgi:DUF4097 and DUF4098 domain-containing protein YvlB